MDVAKVILKVQELYYKGRFEEGLKLLNEVPDDMKTDDVYLLLVVGNKFLNRLYEAEVLIKRVLQSNDPKIRSYARWQAGAIEILKGNVEKGVRDLMKIEPEMRKTAQYPAYIFDLVEGLYIQNRIDECIEYLKKALKFSKERGDINLIVTSISNLALAYDRKGDIKNALEMYLEAAKVSDRQNLMPVLCQTLFNLGELYAELGDFENAFKTVEKIKKKNCAGYEPRRGYYFASLAKIYLLAGKLKEARETLSFLQDVLLERDNSYENITYHVLSILLDFKEGVLTDVEKHIGYVLENWQVEDSVEYRLAKFFRLYLDALSGENVESELDLIFKGDCCNDLIVTVPLYLKLLLNADKRGKALRLVERISHCLKRRYGRTGFFVFFRDDLKEVVKVLSEDVKSPEIILRTGVLLGDREIIEGLFSRFDIVEVVDELRRNPVFHPHLFLTIKSRVKKDEEKEVYKSLVREYLSKNRIVITTFGHLDVYIGPYKLTPGDWIRPVARDLMKFFIVNRNKLIPREVIFEALWPGEDPRKTSSKFRVYISILRDVIEPWLLKEEKPRIIVYTEGKYLFSTETVNLDVEEFETQVKKGLLSEGEESILFLEKAVDLYRGDFLEDDIYSDFIYIERERLKNTFFQAVNRLKDLYAKRGDTGKARFLLDKAFFVDPTNDTIAYDYIQLLLSMGEKANARRIFEIHRETLMKRYEIEPSEKIVSLIKKTE